MIIRSMSSTLRTLSYAALCGALCVGFSFSQADAALTHHWNVEGDAAGTLTDSVGGVDLTYDDPAEGSLSAGAAAPIAGSTQGYTTATGGDATSANADDLFQTGSFSLAMWVQRLEATGSAQPMLLGVIENGSGFNHNYLIRSTSDGSTLAFFSRDDSGNVLNVGSSATLADLGWHHVAATFDWSGTAGDPADVKFYVDGAETGAGNAASWDGWTAADMTQGGIGQSGFTPIQNLDDIRIYDMVLSPQDVAALAVRIPEPGTLALLAMGLVGLSTMRKTRKSL